MQQNLKLLIPAAILFFLIWTIGQNWLLLKNQILSANLIFFSLSLIILIITHIGGSFFWYKILRIISCKISFKEAFRIVIVSNFGRFIPGIILHYVARVYLGKKAGLGVKEGVLSVFLEAYYTLAGAVIISIFALPVAIKLFSPAWLFIGIALAVLFLALFLPPKLIFHWASNIPYFGKHIPISAYRIKYTEHYSLLGISTLLFCLNGLAFYFLSSAFIENPILRVFDVTGLFSAAWIVGFLTPVAPGGLGVSDLSFAFLLTYFYSFSLASFLVISYRFGLLITEGIIFLFAIKLFGFNIVGKKI